MDCSTRRKYKAYFLSYTSTVGKVVAEANENQCIEKDDAILVMKAVSILESIH